MHIFFIFHGWGMAEIKNLTEVQALIAQKRFVFVDFFTSWCCPCKDFAKRVDSDVMPFIAKIDDVEFVKLCVNECKIENGWCKDRKPEVCFKCKDYVPDHEEALKWAEGCGMVVVPTVAVFKNGKQIQVSYRNNFKKENIKNAMYIRGDRENIREIVENILKTAD
jgi:thiol-disulfide isomerase/thioredoxin